MLLTPGLSVAANEREQDAHEHGAAALDLVIDGDSLYIDLDSPADNVLGFEHAPSTQAHHDAIDAAREMLESGAMFVPAAAAGCELASSDIDMGPGDTEGAHDEDDEHAEHDDDKHDDEHAEHDDDKHDDEHAEHDDDKHDDEHAEHDDDKHDDEHAEHDDEHDGDEHAHDEHEGETHSNVIANYVYECNDIAALDSVAVGLFDAFEGFADIDVQMIGPGGQSGAELNPGESNLSLDAIR